MICYYLLGCLIIYPALIRLHKLRDPYLSRTLVSAYIRKSAVCTLEVTDTRIQRRVEASVISVFRLIDMTEFKPCLEPHDFICH